MKSAVITALISVGLSLTSRAQGPETTDVMGGGTPGRADESRTSRSIYGVKDREEKARKVRKAVEERQREDVREEGTRKIHHPKK